MKKDFKNVYQFKITLKGIKPPIWRRILVPENFTFLKFSRTINRSMGWDGGHLHSFFVTDPRSGMKYEISDAKTAKEAGMHNMRDEKKYNISQFFTPENKKGSYTYDFGDDWEHSLALEKILPIEPEKDYPVCIEGKRACPPDDVGGVWGYQEFLEIMKDPDHPEHEEMLEWVGGEFDPEEFDIEDLR